MPRILLVEDDPSLSQAVQDLLSEEHYAVRACMDGESALYEAETGSYDVIVLDIMLPIMDGLTLASTLRKKKVLTPILMLTARDRIEDKVRGLESGADDYLVKPFAATELVARIRALLRRTSPEYQEPNTLEYGEMSLKLDTRELSLGLQAFVVSPKEVLLLELFMRYPGVVMTRSQLIDRLWGYDSDVLENTLEAHISKLRKRLMAAGGPEIQTVRGLGYRLEKVR